MNPKKIPLKLECCPIIEAVVDLRFDTTYPPDAVFGIIYNLFKGEFSSNIENLPVLQIPEQVRMQDPNLIYQPCYRLKDGNFLMQIGPRVISFVNVNAYIGWDKFFARIKKSILSIKQFESQMKFKRIGLRYVNFFEFDIFKRITLSVLMNGSTLTSNHLSLKAVLTTGEYQTNLNLINNVNMMKNGRQINGSIVDIDTYLAKDSIDIYAKPDELIGNAHTEEKILFFNLLNDDLIQELKPEYGEST
jgi:uncharacterized protein (TIGR04255 family)